MADGVSKNINLQGPLDAFRQGLQAIREEAGRPVEIPVRVTGLDRVKQELGGASSAPGAVGDGRDAPGGILPNDQSWIVSPSHRRYRGGGAWDGPEDFSGASSDRLGDLASEGWDKILGGGAYHTMQEAGRFGRKWGGFLDDGRAGEQRTWSDAAASPEGRSYMGAMEDTERLGKKIAGLLRDIAQGGTGAVRAAEDLKRAQAALEEVGKAGAKAAEGLGGDMGGRLRQELDTAQTSAGAGKLSPEDEKLNPRSLMAMLRNPKGAAMHGLEEGLLEKVGGLSPAALGALGLGAAVTGGVYAGWQFNADRADDATKDAMGMGEDVRLSRSLGRKFDFRGSYWNGDRMRAREGENTIEARRILKSMGIGFDNYSGSASGLTDSILSSAMDNGLESTDLSGALGAAVNSGQVKRDQGSMEDYLQKMAGHLQTMAAQGVTSNQALRSIAMLNSQQVQALGKLTEGGGGFNANLLDALSKTGDPALRGEQGASMMARLGQVSGNQVPMLLGRAMSDKKGWSTAIHRLMGDDADNFLSQDSMSQLMEAKQNPELVRYLQLRALRSKDFQGLPDYMVQGIIGGGLPNAVVRKLRADPSMSEEKVQALLKNELRGESYHGRPGEKSVAGDTASALRGGEYASLDQDRRLTAASMEAAEKMKGAASDLKDVTYKLSKALDDFQTGKGNPNTNPFDASMASIPVLGDLYRLNKSRK